MPLEDTWGEMAALADEGLVRAIGVSNFDRALIERCEAVRHVDSLQQEFSMLLSDREVIAWCRTNGTGVLSYGPLAYGLLTGAIGPDTRFDDTDFRSGKDEWDLWQHVFAPGRIERSLAVVDAMRPIADRLGCTPGQLALAWNVHRGDVRDRRHPQPDHVRSNAEAGDLRLDAATLEELERAVALGPAFA